MGRPIYLFICFSYFLNYFLLKNNFNLKKDKNSYFLLKKSEDILNLITKSHFCILNLYKLTKKKKKETQINGLGWLGWKWASLNGSLFFKPNPPIFSG